MAEGLTMKIKLLTCVSTMDHPGIHKLEASLKLFNYDYLIIVDPNINWAWGGLINFYNWCKEQVLQEDGYTHFIYTDGFDTIAMSGMDEVLNKYKGGILYSAEKACFPRSDWSELHISDSRWKYLNHGQFMAPVKEWIELYESMYNPNITCQEAAMHKHLNGYDIKLDTDCGIFQSIAFKGDDEYSIDEGRLINNINKTNPCFVHGNGRSEMDWIYKILGL